MSRVTKKENDDGQIIGEIDRVIHEPARFRIMAHLYVIESADFLFLMRQTGLTHGNLSAHLSKLEASGHIEIKKEFVGKKPHTMLHLTDKGRAAFKEYGQQMKQLFDDLI
ncbi:MAG TPA: transcriptional regulator [Candidatus Methylomirabilis sp.]|nr:transcriptional regulator [Candidatus Methylomirabilis sp.]